MTKATKENFFACLNDANCSDHPLHNYGYIKRYFKKAIFYKQMAEEDISYCESDSAAIALLKNGKYAVVEESSDSSGHG